jgi:hypothetical protein
MVRFKSDLLFGTIRQGIANAIQLPPPGADEGELGKPSLLLMTVPFKDFASLLNKGGSTGYKGGKIPYKGGSTSNKDAYIFNKDGSTGYKGTDIFNKVLNILQGVN